MSAAPERHEPHAYCGRGAAELMNLTGFESKVLRGYRYITTEIPVRRSEFFHRSSVVNPQPNELSNLDLKEGDRVVVDAEHGPSQHKCRYQAVRVKLVEQGTQTEQLCFAPAAGPSRQITDQVGTVCSVHQNGGTLKFGEGCEGLVTFDRNSIPSTIVKPYEKVSEILSVGDKLCFGARLVSNAGTGVSEWQATVIGFGLTGRSEQVFRTRCGLLNSGPPAIP